MDDGRKKAPDEKKEASLASLTAANGVYVSRE